MSELLRSPWALEYPHDQVQYSWQWLLIRTVGFILLAAIVGKFIVPFIGGLLHERQKAIADANAQVEQTLNETRSMRGDYQQRLERIEDETERRMEEAVRESEHLREQILAEARETAEGIVRRGREEVDHERARTMIHLRSQFTEDIIRAAAHAASRSLDASSQSRLVEEFVQKVGAPS